MDWDLFHDAHNIVQKILVLKAIKESVSSKSQINGFHISNELKNEFISLIDKEIQLKNEEFERL